MLTGTAGASKTINSCQEINASNAPSDGVVKLGSDIVDSSTAPCIDINTSDIIFDGQGHLVDGTGQSLSGENGIEVKTPVGVSFFNNVTVRDVTVTNFNKGVRFFNVNENLTVSNVNATSNERDGISVTNGGNIGQGNTLTNVKALDNGDFDGPGIDISSSTVKISGANASGNPREGIEITGGNSADSIVEDAVAVNNGEQGFEVDDADNVTLKNVTAQRNKKFAGVQIGISVGTSVVESNASNSKKGDGFLIQNSEDIYLDNNTAFGNEDGDLRSLTSTNTTVENLNLGDSTSPDTTVDLDPSGVKVNSVSSPAAEPVRQENIGRYMNATNLTVSSSLGVTFEYDDADASEVNESTLSVWRYNGTWAELGGTVDTAANEVQYNINDFGSTFAPLGDRLIDSCADDITVPGRYTLDADITNDSLSSARECIEITASNVVFDGNGNTIEGTNEFFSETGIEVYNSSKELTNVTVKNVNVTGWSADSGTGGVELKDVNGSEGVNVVKNVTAVDNANGVVPSTNPAGVNITGSVFRQNEQNDITVETTPSLNITNNEFFASPDAVFRIGVRGNVTFSGNTFRSDAEGLRLFGSGSEDEITLEDDIFEDTGDLAIDNPRNPKILGENVTFRSTAAGLSSTVDFNISDSASVNLDETESAPADPVVGTNIGQYLNASGDGFGPEFANITFRYEDSDVSGVDESKLEIWKYNGTWTELGSGPATDASANEVQLNLTEKDIDDGSSTLFAPLATKGSPLSSCRDITSSGAYVLTQDLTSSGTCVNVTASNVVIDGNGNKIEASSVASGDEEYGIRVNASDVTVRNVTVDGWGETVTTTSAEEAPLTEREEEVLESAESGGVTPQDIEQEPQSSGVLYEDTSGGEVRNVTATNSYNGVLVTGTTKTNVTDNTATNSQRGIRLFDSDGNNVTNNTANGNAVSGLSVSVGSTGNNLTDNTARGNAYRGVYVFFSDNNELTNNVVDGNDRVGVGLTLSNDNTLSKNEFNANGREGARLTDADSNTLADNTANSNRVGFLLEGSIDGSDDNTLSNNTANGNFEAPLRIDAQSNNNSAGLTISSTSFSFNGISTSSDAEMPDATSLNRFFEASSEEGTFNVSVEYNESSLTVEESELTVQGYDGGSWQEVGSTVNETKDVIVAEVDGTHDAYGVFEDDVTVFSSPLVDAFGSAPTNTGELDPTLYEDLDGDGDGTDVSETVQVFGELVRGNSLDLSEEQVNRLDWDEDGSDEVTVSDMVTLFGEQIRAE